MPKPITRKVKPIAWMVGLMSVLAVLGMFVTPTDRDQYAERAALKNEPLPWGSESLTKLEEGLAAISPIRLANACGLGASSCFKCHNGNRAAAPSIGTPWHDQHSKVNHSCTGCHQGNPRLMKQEMAHRGLVANPNQQPETCAGCHKDGNVEELTAIYLTAGGQ